MEVDLQKYELSWWFATVSAYLTAKKKDNPYFATPWFGAELYYYWYKTVPQLAYKPETENKLFKPVGDSYPKYYDKPRGVFLMMIHGSSVRYAFWRGDRSGPPESTGEWQPDGFSGFLSQSPYHVYLALQIFKTDDCRRSHQALIRYVQVYRGTKVRVEGLQPGWTVKFLDGDRVVSSTVVNNNSVEFDIEKYIIKKGPCPIRDLSIEVLAYNETAGGWIVPPGGTRVVAVSLAGLSSGLYRVKVASVNGEAWSTFRRP